jgi:hypothetical protein
MYTCDSDVVLMLEKCRWRVRLSTDVQKHLTFLLKQTKDWELRKKKRC